MIRVSLIRSSCNCKSLTEEIVREIVRLDLVLVSSSSDSKLPMCCQHTEHLQGRGHHEATGLTAWLPCFWKCLLTWQNVYSAERMSEPYLTSCNSNLWPMQEKQSSRASRKSKKIIFEIFILFLVQIYRIFWIGSKEKYGQIWE